MSSDLPKIACDSIIMYASAVPGSSALADVDHCATGSILLHEGLIHIFSISD